jgi:uncharacterized protein (TIGR02099 family)
MKAIPRIFLRLAAGAGAFLLIVFALAVLWLRYWGLPNIDRYRDDIVSSISRASGMAVSAQRIRGGWEGLRPFVSLDGFQMNDRRGKAALAFDRAEITLSWWNLALGRIRFHDVEFHHPALSLRRGKDGLIYLGDKPLNAAGPEEDDGRFTEWLLAQPRIGIYDATLVWRDEAISASEVALRDVEIVMEKRRGHYHAALVAMPPRELAGRIEMRADVAIRREGLRWRAEGEAYAEAINADLAKIRAHLPLTEALRSGVGSVRVWAQFSGDAVREVVADLSMRDAVGQLDSDALPLDLAAISGRARYRSDAAGFSFGTENLKFRLRNGPEVLPGNFMISRHTDAGKPPRLDVKADGIDLKIAATLLDYFPVPRDVKAQVQRFAPRGRILETSITWDEGAKTKAYAVKGRFENLAVNPVDSFPGVEGLTGRIEGNQGGGTFQLASRRASLALENVFREAIQFDTLDVAGTWRDDATGLQVVIGEARFANTDAEGSLAGTWHSSAESGRPGAVDLKGNLTRARAQSVAKYFPIRFERTRDWLESAIQAGTSPRASFELKGDLYQFPFGGDSPGRFLVEGDVVGGKLKYHPDWPSVDNVVGTFRFENRHMEIRAREATIFASKSNGVVAEIDDFRGKPPVLTVTGDIDASGADTVRFLRESPLAKGPGAFTRAVSIEGPGKLHLQLVFPLFVGEGIRVAGEYTFSGATAGVAKSVEMRDLRGKLSFTQRGVAAPQITGTLFGKPATLAMATASDGLITTQIEGGVDSAALAAYIPAALAAKLDGATSWKAKLTSPRGAAGELVVTSDLKGLASQLPAPFAKAADDAIGFTFTMPGVGTETAASTVAMGDIHGRFSRGADDKWSAALKFGAPLDKEPVREGIWLHGELASLDVDAWRSLFAAPSEEVAQPPPAVVELRGFDIKVTKARYLGRDFNNVRVALARDGQHWKGRLEGPNVLGDVDWSFEGKGRLVARFERMFLAEGALSTSDAPRSPQADLPALDIQAKRFEFKGHWLGELDLKAEAAGDEWRIEKLDISNPHSKFASNGVWRRTGTGSLTTLNLKLEASDLNALFTQFGYGDYLRRGTGALEGTLVWPGFPYEFTVGNLAGTFAVSAAKGQFSKIQPGAGKILGLISLQALPRRATFDFSDVFSEGFAFERIHGDVKIARGVMITNNFEISGTAAFVSLAGELSMPQETQALTMHVVPEIGEGVALAAAVVGTPVLGLSTLLVSKLLNNPFGKVVAYEYQITGSWDNPQVVRTSAPPPKTAANPEIPAARTTQQ